MLSSWVFQKWQNLGLCLPFTSLHPHIRDRPHLFENLKSEIWGDASGHLWTPDYLYLRSFLAGFLFVISGINMRRFRSFLFPSLFSNRKDRGRGWVGVGISVGVFQMKLHVFRVKGF